MPPEILSRKLYDPKTKAPLEPLSPITSLIKVIPVFRVIAYAIPIKGAIAYIRFLSSSSMLTRAIEVPIQMAVPILN